MNKIYQVVGLYDASCGADSIVDASPWVETFKTKEEAEKACELVNDFYFEKVGIHCAFEVREIDLDHLDTVESLNNELIEEYNECWNPEC